MASVATPQTEILSAIQALGWTLQSVQFSNGQYIAKAMNDSTGQDVERNGTSPEVAIAAVYQYANRANSIRGYAKTAAWDASHWQPHTEQIAETYSKLPTYDEKAAQAWQALGAESKIQADAIRKQLRVDVVDDPEPYKNMKEMCEDVHKNKHFAVSRSGAEHPLWSIEDTVNFRIVHDILGHCQSGGDFSLSGEHKAVSTHMPLVSPLAREALFVETLGKAAYQHHYHGHGPQKIALMSEYLSPVQQKEGEHVFVPHGGIPQVMEQDPMIPQGAWVDPTGQGYQSPTFGLGNPVMQGYEVPNGSAIKFNPKGRGSAVEQGREDRAYAPSSKEADDVESKIGNFDSKHVASSHKPRVADYQGWSNWETWHTKLVIDNEQEIHKQAWRLARGSVYEADLANKLESLYWEWEPDYMSETWGPDPNQQGQKENINWLEIAEHLMAEVKEDEAYSDTSQSDLTLPEGWQ